MKRPGESCPATTVQSNATSGWLAALAVILHLVYTANFLYFFVDDEAIPFVYAQNLLKGYGLSYSAADGHVEGYSDFLHIWFSAIVLGVVRLLHVDKYWVFFIGKAVSILAGALVIVLAWAILRRLRVRPAAMAASLAFLALAGPLAVWSCSSIEAVPFTLALVAFVWALVSCRDRVALVCAVIMCLDRIDGFVYAGVLLAAFASSADRERRRLLAVRLAVPLAILLAVYNGWRLVYFHDWLPMPLQAKVLYKLTGGTHLVTKTPSSPYWVRFLQSYGWPAGVLLVVALIQSFRIGRSARAIAVAGAVLFLYVAIVGDWMFGFRFFVAILPLFAVTIGCALSVVAARHPRAAQAIAFGVIVWAGFAAPAFVERYRASDGRESFLQAPSSDLHKFFFPYFSLYETARVMIPVGEIVAYNQSGFVPFMLDLRNIDDLGICTRFYAEMPTTDVFFTEVGRYEPLTDNPVLTAGQAYLLYRDVQYVLVRMDLLTKANGAMVPPTLMGGFYALAAVDGEHQNAVYRRTSRPAGAYGSDPDSFRENVAHISRLRHVMLNDVVVRPSEWSRELPFLRQAEGELPLTNREELAIVFSTSDESIREISIDRITVDVPARLELTLWSKDGTNVFRQSEELVANEPRPVRTDVPTGLKASRFVLDVSSEAEPAGSVHLSDVRIQGQGRELERYIARALHFPRPGAPRKSRG